MKIDFTFEPMRWELGETAGHLRQIHQYELLGIAPELPRWMLSFEDIDSGAVIFMDDEELGMVRERVQEAWEARGEVVSDGPPGSEARPTRHRIACRLMGILGVAVRYSQQTFPPCPPWIVTFIDNDGSFLEVNLTTIHYAMLVAALQAPEEGWESRP